MLSLSPEYSTILNIIKSFIRNLSGVQINFPKNKITVDFNSKTYTIPEMIKFIKEIIDQINTLIKYTNYDLKNYSTNVTPILSKTNILHDNSQEIGTSLKSGIIHEVISRNGQILGCGRLLHYSMIPHIPTLVDKKNIEVYKLFLSLISPIENIKNSRRHRPDGLTNIKRDNMLRKMQCYFIIQDLIRYSRKQPIQKSKEWLTKRLGYITASNVAVALGKNKYKSYIDAMLEKSGITEPFKGNEATRFGEKFEDVAAKIYMLETNNNPNIKAKFFESAFIPSKDPRYCFVGGSPDGLILKKVYDDNGNFISRDGYIIEIKCPMRRWPRGTVPEHYWIQMQIQLEVTNIEVAYFLDFKFREFEKFNDMCYHPYGYLYKGAVIDIIKWENYNVDQSNSTEDYIYDLKRHYSPIFEKEDNNYLVKKWVNETVSKIKKTGDYVRYSIKYWILCNRYYVRVDRDRQWMVNNIDTMRQYWLDINYYPHYFHELYKDLIVTNE